MTWEHMTSRKIDSILFIRSAQPAIDRGWDTIDVDSCLRALGFQTENLFVGTEKALKSFLSSCPPNILAWPVCYTVGGNLAGRLVADFLEEYGVPFVGPNPRALALSSKIWLKSAIAGCTVHTPSYRLIDEDSIGTIPFSIPYVMKCEYSCDSIGVKVVHSPTEAYDIWLKLTRSYGQRIIAEEWARSREYTVAYIPRRTSEPIVASLELTLLTDSLIVDAQAKSDNRLLCFTVPDREISARLKRCACEFANHLTIDGHFRVDILQDADELSVIDFNPLPQMHFSKASFSYFPMALREVYGMDQEEVVCTILESVQEKWQFSFAHDIHWRNHKVIDSEVIE